MWFVMKYLKYCGICEFGVNRRVFVMFRRFFVKAVAESRVSCILYISCLL